MWYLLQTLIAGYVAYTWCTLPGNGPENFGHGLFLGALIAWVVTAVIATFYDAHKQSIRHKQATPVKSLGLARKLLNRWGSK